jgi:hypothetical protein
VSVVQRWCGAEIVCILVSEMGNETSQLQRSNGSDISDRHGVSRSTYNHVWECIDVFSGKINPCPLLVAM